MNVNREIRSTIPALTMMTDMWEEEDEEKEEGTGGGL